MDKNTVLLRDTEAFMRGELDNVTVAQNSPLPVQFLDDARALIVGGFAEPIAKELPLEYAVEMNNLIHLEMKGSIG